MDKITELINIDDVVNGEDSEGKFINADEVNKFFNYLPINANFFNIDILVR